MRFTIKGLGVAVLTLTTSVSALAGPGDEAVPFDFRRGHLIVVQGTIDGSDPVRMMIDTGATCTIIDRRLAEKLHLKSLQSNVDVRNTGGKTTRRTMVLVPKLRVGPIVTTRACPVEDLTRHNVEVIVGLNVLRRHNFTIDFSSRKLLFDRTNVSNSGYRFDPQEPLIVVPVRIENRTLRLVVDTGAKESSLYDGDVNDWIGGNSNRWNITTEQLGGRQKAREVYVSEFELGTSKWRNLKVLVLKCRKDTPKQAWAGVLAPASLNLNWMHFDFQQGLLTWN